MTIRSVLAKENGQLTIGCVATRLVSLPRRPRATTTDNLVPSATETRDIEARTPSVRAIPSPERQHSGGSGSGQPRISPFKSFADGPRSEERRVGKEGKTQAS